MVFNHMRPLNFIEHCFSQGDISILCRDGGCLKMLKSSLSKYQIIMLYNILSYYCIVQYSSNIFFSLTVPSVAGRFQPMGLQAGKIQRARDWALFWKVEEQTGKCTAFCAAILALQPEGNAAQAQFCQTCAVSKDIQRSEGASADGETVPLKHDLIFIWSDCVCCLQCSEELQRNIEF